MPAPAPGPAPEGGSGDSGNTDPTFTVNESGSAPDVIISFTNAGAAISVVETGGKLVFTSGSTSRTTTANSGGIAEIQIGSGITLSAAATVFNNKAVTGAGNLTLAGQSAVADIGDITGFPGVDGTVTYSLTDAAATLAVAPFEMLNGATSITVTGTPTIAEISTIVANGADLGHSTYTLVNAVLDLGADQTVAAIEAIDTTGAAAIVAAAANDPALTLNVQYTLSDSAANLDSADAAILNGATAITATGTDGPDNVDLSNNANGPVTVGVTINLLAGNDSFVAGAGTTAAAVGAANGVDTITDFNSTDNDVLAVSALLNGAPEAFVNGNFLGVQVGKAANNVVVITDELETNLFGGPADGSLNAVYVDLLASAVSNAAGSGTIPGSLSPTRAIPITCS